MDIICRELTVCLVSILVKLVWMRYSAILVNLKVLE